MKRFWLGAALLCLLLALSLTAALGMERLCSPIARELDLAAQYAQAGAWEQALSQSRSARQRWERHRKAVASFTLHDPLEEVDALFEALEIFSQQRDATHFAEYCAQIESLTEAITEAQSATWWNIL